MRWEELTGDQFPEVVRQVEGFGTLTLMAVSAAVIAGLLLGVILTRRKSAS